MSSVIGIFQLSQVGESGHCRDIPTGKRLWSVAILPGHESKLDEELEIEGLDPFIKECLVRIKDKGANSFHGIMALSYNPTLKEICEVMLEKFRAEGSAPRRLVFSIKPRILTVEEMTEVDFINTERECELEAARVMKIYFDRGLIGERDWRWTALEQYWSGRIVPDNLSDTEVRVCIDLASCLINITYRGHGFATNMFNMMRVALENFGKGRVE